MSTLEIITNNDLLRKPDAWFTVPQIELKYKVTAHGNRLINLKTVFYERMCSRREREEDRPKYRHKRASEKLGVNTNYVKMTICTLYNVQCTVVKQVS